MEHRDIPASQQHGIVRWYCADIPARDALTLTAADLGKLAQVGTGAGAAFYVLVGTGPTVWKTTGTDTVASPYVTSLDFSGNTISITLSDTTVLQAVGIAASGDVLNAISIADAALVAHAADVDPHPQYTTTAEASAAAPVQSVNGLTGAVVLAEEVQEYANLAGFPGTGASGTLYVAADTGLVYRWDGAAYAGVSGPGGVSFFESLEYTASPNNVRYCILWRADPTGGVDADICLQPFGQGALLASPPDGTATFGNKRGVRAVDWQMERAAATQVASGLNSVISGGLRNSATGQYCVVGGGYTNTAQGIASVVAGGDTNNITSTGSSYSTISGGSGNNITGTSRQYCTIGGGSANSIAANYATVSGGVSNTISAGATHSVVSGGNAHNISTSGTYATIGGGNSNSASATLATVAGGSGNNGSGQYCAIVGGANNGAGGSYAVAGGQANTVAGSWSVAFGQSNVVMGTHGAAFGAYGDSYMLNGALVHSSGRITTSGDLQTRNVILAARTTNATPTVLSVSGAAPSVYTQLCPQNYTIQAIRGRCIARIPTSSADYAVWEFTAYVKRDSSVASVALLGAVSLTLVHFAGTGNTWTLAIGVDAVTLGSLTVTATGEAAKTIVWGCSLEVLEVQDLS